MYGVPRIQLVSPEFSRARQLEQTVLLAEVGEVDE
jgi:hypothetical protein